MKKIIRMSCLHLRASHELQIHELGHVFPTQGGLGFRKTCTKCKAWLMCNCERNWFLKFLPNYIARLEKTNNGLVITSNCLTCSKGNHINQRWEKFKQVVEYILKTDKTFFNYCYGSPKSGYEKDYILRSGNSCRKAEMAEIRQVQARKLLNVYLYKTI